MSINRTKGNVLLLPNPRTKQYTEELPNDQVLMIETSDPKSKSRSDIATWAKRTGNEFLKVADASGT